MQDQDLTSRRILTGVALLLLLLLLSFVMLSKPDSAPVAYHIDSGGVRVTEPEANGQPPATIESVDVNPYPATTPTTENSEIETIALADETRDFGSINGRISMIQDLPITVPAKPKPEPAPVIERVAIAAISEPARIVRPKPKRSPPAIVKPRSTVVEARPAEMVPVAGASRPVARYQRLDSSGAAATGDAPWSCVKDNHGDLVWEVKTSDSGPRDADNLYTWFDPTQRGQSGVEDGGRCSGSIDCDTHSYQVAMNARNLCGYSDWRLPTREELQSLVVFDSDQTGATIDENYFPAAAASWYWTASTNQRRPEYAWYVLFRNGIPLNDLKARPKHIRLVRGNRLTLASNP